MKLHRMNGFNLIELMVVVAIIGILAAIAMPSYKNYVVRGARAAAQTELLEMASLQEKVYLNSSAYTADITAAYNGTTTGGLGRTSGRTPDGKYDLSFDITVPSQTYILTATPVVGSTQEGDGSLSISENGQKLWDGNPW